MNKQLVDTIWSQFGGNQFGYMIGARNLVGFDDALSFRFGRNKSKSNIVKVTLRPSDTYTMEFGHTRKVGYEIKYFIDKIFDDVYAEDLVRLFELHTGMATKLPRVVRS